MRLFLTWIIIPYYVVIAAGVLFSVYQSKCLLGKKELIQMVCKMQKKPTTTRKQKRKQTLNH